LAITYDAGTDTITITGYTEGTPCTFTDIDNADTANGWGQVSKQGTNQFLFDCKLSIGDGSTATWFADTDKQIIFSSSVTGGIITTKNNANFRLGQLDDASTKSSSRGCSLISLATSNDWFYGNTGGKIKLYSSHVAKAGGRWYIEAQSSESELYNTIFTRNAFPHKWTDADIYNIYVSQSSMGASDFNPSTADTIHFHDINLRLIMIAYGTPDVFCSNIKASHYTGAAILHFSSNNVYLIDCVFDSWTMQFWGTGPWGEIYRQYTFNLQVTEEDGTAIENATVTLYDKDDNTVFSVSTAADGTIAEQTVSRGYYNQANGDTLQDYGPFTLTIEKDGYVTYIHEQFILYEPVNLKIALMDELDGTATADEVLTGETFYSTDPRTQLTGTLVQSGGGHPTPPKDKFPLVLGLDLKQKELRWVLPIKLKKEPVY
jgi:hypothetical protein